MDGPTVDTERQGGLEEKLALTSRHSLGLRNVKNKKSGHRQRHRLVIANGRAYRRRKANRESDLALLRDIVVNSWNREGEFRRLKVCPVESLGSGQHTVAIRGLLLKRTFISL